MQNPKQLRSKGFFKKVNTG